MKKSSFKIIFLLILLSVLAIGGCGTFSQIEDAGIISHSEGSQGINLLALKQLNKGGCALASLGAVLNHWGTTVSQLELKQMLDPQKKEGYSLEELKAVATQFGFSGFVISSNLEELKKHSDLGRPGIVFIKLGKSRNHALVVFSVSQPIGYPPYSTLRVMDPLKGKFSDVSAKSFLPRWRALGSPLLLIARQQKRGAK